MDSISEKRQIQCCIFPPAEFPPQKSHKIAHFQVSENEEKWLLPVGQSDKLKFSTNHLLKVDFCVFLLVSSSHLEWRNILKRSPPESGFLCISLSSHLAEWRKIQQNWGSQSIRSRNELFVFFQCFLIFLGRIFTICIIFIAAALAKQKNWNY